MTQRDCPWKCRKDEGGPLAWLGVYLQGWIAKKWAAVCEFFSGQLRQKWYAVAGTKFTKPGTFQPTPVGYRSNRSRIRNRCPRAVDRSRRSPLPPRERGREGGEMRNGRGRRVTDGSWGGSFVGKKRLLQALGGGESLLHHEPMVCKMYLIFEWITILLPESSSRPSTRPITQLSP